MHMFISDVNQEMQLTIMVDDLVIGQAERTKFEIATQLDQLKFLRTFYRREDSFFF